MSKFPHYFQPDAMNCGPTCLRIVAKLTAPPSGLYLEKVCYEGVTLHFDEEI
jgi:hypothetical protein